MKVHHSNDTLILSQSHYVSDLLPKFHITTCKPCATAFTSGSHLSAYDGELLSNAIEYQSMVGSLHYLVLIRPDIAFTVNQVCQFLHQPKMSHL